MSVTETSNRQNFTLMVCWALKHPESEKDWQEFIPAIDAQVEIPGVLSVEHGRRAKQIDWVGPDDQFDYAMILKFDTIENVRAYLPHPIHQKMAGMLYQHGSNIRGFWIKN